MLRQTLAVAPLLLASTATLADPCQDLMAQIDAKIRASGVSSFTLVAVDLAADSPGQVVGSCGRGSKKIVYSRTATATAASGAASASRAKPRARLQDGILTECKDGSMSVGGDCGK